MFASPVEALEHFGTKGMKWGVRKERDQSTESASARRQSRRNLDSYIWERTKNEQVFRSMSPEEYNALSTKGRAFVEGHKFQRITADPKASLNGSTYVSHTFEDAQFYRATIPVKGTQGPETQPGSKEYRTAHYEATLKATKKLSSPSEKERVDAFIELMHEPTIFRKGKNAPITGRQYLEAGRAGKFLYRKYDDKEVALREWHDFAASQGNRDNPLVQAYFNKMRKRGYGVLPDDNDRGRLAKDPVILLDPKSVEKLKVRRLTTDEINRAQRDLRP